MSAAEEGKNSSSSGEMPHATQTNVVRAHTDESAEVAAAPLPQPVSSLFPLANNNLQDLVEYRVRPGIGVAIMSRVARPRRSHFCFVTAQHAVPAPTRSSVQTGMATHAELTSALIFLNHSCRPTVELDVGGPGADAPGAAAAAAAEAPIVASDCHGGNPTEQYNGDEDADDDTVRRSRFPPGAVGEVRVARNRDLAVGDELAFFYPSTEWDSAARFDCLCGAGDGICIGVQRGSKYLPRTLLDRYFINAHVRQLFAERDGNEECINGFSEKA